MKNRPTINKIESTTTPSPRSKAKVLLSRLDVYNNLAVELLLEYVENVNTIIENKKDSAEKEVILPIRSEWEYLTFEKIAKIEMQNKLIVKG